MKLESHDGGGGSVDEVVPVLVVGGGGAGLTASMLLARQGVEHLLVSARPDTSDLPKAHVLNQRAMEVLEDVGVVFSVKTGRESRFALDPRPIVSAQEYLEHVSRQWDTALARLKALVEQT